MDDLITKRIIVIGIVQVVLLILVFALKARRGRGDKTIAVAPASGTPPAPDPYAWHPQSWAWPVGMIVLFAGGAWLCRPVSNWYGDRHPPAVEYRKTLLETASKQLHCPIEQLTVESVGHKGAKVTGCGGNTQLCYGGRHAVWAGCSLLE